MWLANKPNGLYYQERVYNPLNGQSRIVSVKVKVNTPAGRKQARELLSARCGRIENPHLKLSDLAEPFIKSKKTYSETALKGLRQRINVVVNILEDPYIDTLTAGYVKSKIMATAKEPVTINNKVATVKSLLKWAYQNDLLTDRTVIDKLTAIPDNRRQRIAEKYLEPDDLRRLLDAMPEPWKKLAEFISLTGCRAGEALALDWSDIGEEYIHINKSIDPNTHKIGPTKTAASERDIYIQPELKSLIQPVLEPHKPVFVDANGKRLKYPAFLNVLKRTAKKILNKDVSTHILRHTHASILAAKGVPVETISRRLGHDNGIITREIYLHVTSERQKKDNEELKKVSILN